ncbi:hypothetical protein [Herbidospora daliensis]|uniref:hypothetical protein n=1 Tax=Herbidospora daliensis TaxID=295585 RepID=UPI0007827176|nr:hypothetical protein [Herbidospora daliensis]
MTRYEVQHAYRADRDGDVLGPWEAGETVELEPEVADWVNNDSPGALQEAKETPAKPRQAKPAPDRQHKGAANR